MIICAREQCKAGFTPKTHNQKYCGSECCRIETNRRIMEKYYERRDQRLGKTRYCDECHVTKLSRYNDTRTCSACETKGASESRSMLLSMLSIVNVPSMV